MSQFNTMSLPIQRIEGKPNRGRRPTHLQQIIIGKSNFSTITYRSQYILFRTVRLQLIFAFGTFYSFLAGLGKSVQHYLLICLKTMDNPFQLSRKQALSAYCLTNIYFYTSDRHIQPLFGLLYTLFLCITEKNSLFCF